MSGFLTLIKRDIRLALREGGAVATALGFYLIVVAVMPLGLGPDLKLLGRIAPGVLWVALLLSALLSLDRIFMNDFEDGSLEIMALGPLPLELVVVAKSLAHWITTGIPLALAAPVLGLLLNLDGGAYGVLVLTTLIGTLGVSFIGAIGAALTLGLGRGGLLLSLLILPLYVPILIFGVSSIMSVITGPSTFAASFMILSAISLAAVVLTPWAAGAALRMQFR